MIDPHVEIQAGGKTYKLSPTLDALEKIGNRFGDLMSCADKIRRYSPEAIFFVISAGAGLNKDETARMKREVTRAGLERVTKPLAEYIGLFLGPEEEEHEPGEG